MTALSIRPTVSWVIVDQITGKSVCETFSRKIVDAINTSRYRAIPIEEYLPGLNRAIKANGGVQP